MGQGQSANQVDVAITNTPMEMTVDDLKVKTVMFSSGEDPDEDFTDIVIDTQFNSLRQSLMTLPSMLPLRPRTIDPKTITAYLERPLKDSFLIAYKNSHMPLELRNVIVLGQTGAGKSSTVCHLLGKELPKLQCSTDVIEVTPGLYWQSKGSNMLREVTRDNEVKSYKQAILSGVGASNEVTHSDLSLQQRHVLDRNRNRTITNPPNDPNLPSELKSYSSPFVEDVQNAISKEITNADLKGDPLPSLDPSSILLYQIIDCGGMPFFRSLLPQFFPSAENSVFLVIHKLTDRLHDPGQIRVLKNGRLVHQEELSRTNMEEIFDWLKIAHSCTEPSSSGGHIGNTFVVGTHLDHLIQVCFNSESLAMEAAYTATNHICEKVVNDPVHSILDPEPVFLNNGLAGTDKCPGINKLRKKLWEYKSPSGKAVELPVLWCLFIRRMREIASETKKPVLSLEQFFKMSEDYHLTRSEAQQVLELCKKHCIVFHLHTSSYLNQYVFIDMQWLFTSLSNIFKQPNCYAKRGQHFSDWKDLMETGFMSVHFHSHLFFRTPQVDCLPSTWASDLLEQLHLMSRVSVKKGDGFFCPVLLPLTSPDHHTDTTLYDPFHHDSDCDSIHILPNQNHNIPPGYTARLFTVISSISDKIKLVYCTNQASATFQLFTNNPNESYFVRISEGKDAGGSICLEFCSAFHINRIKLTRLSSIAHTILKMVSDASQTLKATWKLATSLNCPMGLHEKSDDNTANDDNRSAILVTCNNKNCQLEYMHLAQIHTKPSNNSKPFVECCITQNRMFFTDLPPSQLIWLKNLVKERLEADQLEQLLRKLEKEACDPTECLVHSYPAIHSPLSVNSCSSRRIAVPLTRQQLLARPQSRSLNAFDTIHDDPITMRTCRARSHASSLSSSPPEYSNLREYFSSYFIVMEDHLDLDICNHLFQHGVLNNDERTRILSINAPSTGSTDPSAQPRCRASAISVLMEIIKANQLHGFMGFVTVLESTIDNDSSSTSGCGHQIILDNLQKDSNFMKIKLHWLHSVTVCR